MTQWKWNQSASYTHVLTHRGQQGGQNIGTYTEFYMTKFRGIFAAIDQG